MGFKDLFSSAGRSKSRLEKYIRKVENKYTQSAERYHAMTQLIELGTTPALVGLLRRFNISSSKSIEDEEEKGWVYRRLSGMDASVVLPATKQFCLAHENIAWALRIVEDLANEDQEWDILNALLAQHPPGYERNPAKKLQMLTHLAEIDDPRVPEILSGYVDDADESIRFFSVEALLDIGEPSAIPSLVSRLDNQEEDSLRLRTAILNGFARQQWDLSEHAELVRKNIGNEGHTFDGTNVHEP
ncbi:MAG: HEAT repeat domain-containing protein [Nannocystaceae bacterium]